MRKSYIDSGLSRNEVNKSTGKVVRAFKWAVSEEIIPPPVHHGLKAVAGLRRGPADVRESAPVKPAPPAFVEAIRPHVARQVWTMVELQRLSDMRPGEVVSMRTIDVEVGGKVWTDTPEAHKTEHHGKKRLIHLGPLAQAILKPWLRPDLELPVFSPSEARAERLAEQRRLRKTSVQPSQLSRAKPRPKKIPGASCSVESYRAVARLQVLSDGASWIWKAADWALTGCRQTLEIDHASQHIAAAGKRLYGEGKAEATRFHVHGRRWLTKEGWTKICRLIGEELGCEDTPKRRKAVGRLLNYLLVHAGRIDYAERLAAGEAIGSGEMEGAAKTLGLRPKARGAR